MIINVAAYENVPPDSEKESSAIFSRFNVNLIKERF